MENYPFFSWTITIRYYEHTLKGSLPMARGSIAHMSLGCEISMATVLYTINLIRAVIIRKFRLSCKWLTSIMYESKMIAYMSTVEKPGTPTSLHCKSHAHTYSNCRVVVGCSPFHLPLKGINCISFC